MNPVSNKCHVLTIKISLLILKMNCYSQEEKVNFIKWYYSGLSFRDIQATFAGFYPERPILNLNTLNRIVRHFETNGTVNKKCKCQNVTAGASREKVDAVLLSVVENKNVSLRQIGNNLGIHFTTAQKILKSQDPRFRSYKYEKHQKIFEEDKEKRMQFCEIMMEMANDDRNFLSRILFSDECRFQLTGEPNQQNYRYWSTQNEHLMLQTHTQYRGSVNVWAGILGPHIIGPFFIADRLTGAAYLNFLQEEVGPAIDELGINYEFWYQHDGCPAHYQRDVLDYLNHVFPNRWIGRGGEINWPPRSPDLSPNDFFLWGTLHDRLYNGRTYQNVDALRAAILAECRQISHYQLAATRRNFYDRLGYCSAVNGDLFEHLI